MCVPPVDCAVSSGQTEGRCCISAGQQHHATAAVRAVKVSHSSALPVLGESALTSWADCVVQLGQPLLFEWLGLV
jgi:hypothetical protein